LLLLLIDRLATKGVACSDWDDLASTISGTRSEPNIEVIKCIIELVPPQKTGVQLPADDFVHSNPQVGSKRKTASLQRVVCLNCVYIHVDVYLVHANSILVLI
jgi:hypothetical protein